MDRRDFLKIIALIPISIEKINQSKPLEQMLDKEIFQHDESLFPTTPWIIGRRDIWLEVYKTPENKKIFFDEELNTIYTKVEHPDLSILTPNYQNKWDENLEKMNDDIVRSIRYRFSVLGNGDDISKYPDYKEYLKIQEAVKPWLNNISKKDLKEFYKKRSDNLRMQSGRREKMIKAVQRWRIHKDKMIKAIKEADVPLQFLALPAHESNYNILARSRENAVGIWQFIYSTARIKWKDSQLAITRNLDERMDPEKSTYHAANYLLDNIDFFKDNEECSTVLALLGYIGNRDYVKRDLNGKLKTGQKLWNENLSPGERIEFFIRYRNQKRVSHGFDTENYYPMFLAGIEIMHNPEKHFGFIQGLNHEEIEEQLSYKKDTIRLASKTNEGYYLAKPRRGEGIDLFCRRHGITRNELYELNPIVKIKRIIDYSKDYKIPNK